MRWIDDKYKNISITTDSLPSASSETLGSWLYENASQIWSTLPTPKASLQLYSWKEIKQIGDALSAGIINLSTVNLTYNITSGQTKTVIINNESHTCRLIGILHDKSISSSVTYLGFTFEILDLLDTKMALYNSASVPNASWQESNIRNYLANTISSITDPELIAVISIAAKQCCASVTSSTPQYYDRQKFWILSETELTGESSHTISGQPEGTQYEFYRDYASRADYIKELDGVATAYWLRSPYEYNSSTGNSSFACVINTGVTSINTVSSSIGVSPCFCIGQATFCLLSSIMESLNNGSHELQFRVNSTSILSNKIYLYKGSSPTTDVYFLTADSGNPNFTVLRTAGGSTYDDFIVQESSTPPTPSTQTTAVTFVPSSGGGGIMYTTDGGPEVTTISTNQTVTITADIINFTVDAQSSTKITVTDGQGTVLYEGQNYTFGASSLRPTITVTQSVLDTWSFQVTDSNNVTHNYTCTAESTWAQFIATDPVGQVLFGVESGTNYVWYDNNSGYLYYDSAKTVHVSNSQTIMSNREYYSGGTAPTPETTVSGTWKFNDTVNAPSTELSQENLSFVSGGSSFTSIFARINNDVITYDSQGVYSFSFDEWPNVIYKEISFNGNNTMSQDFYTWFSANATQIS